MSEAGEVVEHRHDDGVLRWELKNEKRRNAVSPAMLRFIASRCSELRGEVVILEGAGDSGFCSGFDLTELEVQGASSPDLTLVAATGAMQCADATFVASIAGHAIGAGVELACSCDFRIATEQTRFRIPAGRLCVVYHAAGLVRIHAAMGGALTRRLVLAGEEVSANEAHAAGALYAMTGASERQALALSLAKQVRAQAPASVRGNRTMLRAIDRRELPEDLLTAHEEARKHAYRSEDHAEARAAVRERRRPVWRDC